MHFKPYVQLSRKIHIFSKRNRLILILIFFQVKKTFREPNWWSHHDKWGNKRLDWLPTNNEIPKNLGERPTIAHLQDLEVCRNLTSLLVNV